MAWTKEARDAAALTRKMHASAISKTRQAKSVGEHRLAESAHTSAFFQAKKVGKLKLAGVHQKLATRHFKTHNKMTKEAAPGFGRTLNVMDRVSLKK